MSSTIALSKVALLLIVAMPFLSLDSSNSAHAAPLPFLVRKSIAHSGSGKVGEIKRSLFVASVPGEAGMKKRCGNAYSGAGGSANGGSSNSHSSGLVNLNALNFDSYNGGDGGDAGSGDAYAYGACPTDDSGFSGAPVVNLAHTSASSSTSSAPSPAPPASSSVANDSPYAIQAAPTDSVIPTSTWISTTAVSTSVAPAPTFLVASVSAGPDGALTIDDFKPTSAPYAPLFTATISRSSTASPTSTSTAPTFTPLAPTSTAPMVAVQSVAAPISKAPATSAVGGSYSGAGGSANGGNVQQSQNGLVNVNALNFGSSNGGNGGDASSGSINSESCDLDRPRRAFNAPRGSDLFVTIFA